MVLFTVDSYAIEVGSPAPDFSLKTLEGKEYDAEDITQETFYINPCRIIMRRG
jgi:hypothetical protein